MISRDGTRPARHAVIVAGFLASAIVLGGGGSPNPGTEIILQLLFVGAALAWLWIPTEDSASRLAASVWAVVGLVAALPAVQLIPLPPGLWAHLAGQEDRVAALALVGQETSWRPWSQAPSLTFASLLAMVPALFVFVATASLDIKGRSLLVRVIAAMALITALIGALQVSLGNEGLNLYREYPRGVVTGFQANRNSTADVLLIGMAATAAFLAPALSAGKQGGAGVLANYRTAGIAATSLLLVLLFAVVLTASRTGIALIPLALAGIWVMLRPKLAGLGRWRFLPLASAGALALLCLLISFAGETTLARVADRFAFEGEFRPELWRDGWFAMQRAWPVGVGMGGAQPALIAAERLEILGPKLPNRVHNDYLELALEGGAFGFIVLAAVVAILARLAWSTWRNRPEQRPLTACGLTLLAIVAAHSFVDYPLRSMALACLAGTGAGLLVAAQSAGAHRSTAAEGSGG